MKKAGITNPADFKITLPDDNSLTSVWKNIDLLNDAMQAGAIPNTYESYCKNTNRAIFSRGEKDTTEADIDKEQTEQCLDKTRGTFSNIARVNQALRKLREKGTVIFMAGEELPSASEKNPTTGSSQVTNYFTLIPQQGDKRTPFVVVDRLDGQVGDPVQGKPITPPWIHNTRDRTKNDPQFKIVESNGRLTLHRTVRVDEKTQTAQQCLSIMQGANAQGLCKPVPYNIARHIDLTLKNGNPLSKEEIATYKSLKRSHSDLTMEFSPSHPKALEIGKKLNQITDGRIICLSTQNCVIRNHNPTENWDSITVVKQGAAWTIKPINTGEAATSYSTPAVVWKVLQTFDR
jgi:hypothetical protein